MSAGYCLLIIVSVVWLHPPSATSCRNFDWVNVCPHDWWWITYRGIEGSTCYKYYHGEVQFFHAQERCRYHSPSADLIDIANATEDRIVRKYIVPNGKDYAWIGLRLYGSTWYWSSGGVLKDGDYNNTNNVHDIHYRKCVRQTKTMGWLRTNCSSYLPGYICEIQRKGDIFKNIIRDGCEGRPERKVAISNHNLNTRPAYGFDFNDRTCAQTNTHSKPWWLVKLNDVFLVQSLYIKVSSHKSLGKFKIGVMFDIQGTSITIPNDYPVCITQTNYLRRNHAYGFVCDKPLMGRVVILQLQYRDYLRVCELTPFGIRLRDGATETSRTSMKNMHQDYNLPSNLGSDSNINTCFHTRKNTDSWWAVDLNDFYSLAGVVIVNRRTNKERFKKFDIVVTENLNEVVDELALCYKGDITLERYEITCDTIWKGRYVVIRKYDTVSSYFHLCEVEAYVFKEPIEESSQTSRQIGSGHFGSRQIGSGQEKHRSTFNLIAFGTLFSTALTSNQNIWN